MLKQKILTAEPTKNNNLLLDDSDYQKIKLIGQGTFGKVYLVKNTKNGEQYALKQVLQDKRYKNRQLSIISRIQHCNIINMKQYFIRIVDSNSYLNLIMECIPTNLNTLIKQKRKLKHTFTPIARKLIAFQLFKALYYMQLTSICHRDLKPPNILLNDKSFEVKVCDFGSAKIFDKQQNNVTYICSRYYRAPELVMEDTTYGVEVDMWSAGCIITELLTLEPLFPGDSSQQQLIEIIKVLGTPPKKMLDLYEEEKNTQYHLPQIKPSQWDIVLAKYHPEQDLIDLISKMLTYESKQRIKPLQALKHPYFHDLPSHLEHIKQIEHIFYFRDLQNPYNYEQIQKLQRLYPQHQLELKQKTNQSNLEESSKPYSTPNTIIE